MRKTWMVMVFGFALALMLAVTAQAATIYLNPSTFEALVPGGIITENFEDGTLQPGLSIVSDYSGATIVSGHYLDIVGGSSDWKTTFNQSNSFGTGFGVYIDLYYPGGPGQGIAVSVVNGSGGLIEYIGEIPNTNRGEFWGFITPYNFDHVLFSKGTQTGTRETYWAVDLQYARNPVPEPGTMLLLGSGLVGLAGWGRKKFRK